MLTRRPMLHQQHIPLMMISPPPPSSTFDGEIDDQNTTRTNENKYMAEDVDDPILLLPESLEDLFSPEFFDSISSSSLSPFAEIETTINNDAGGKEENFPSSSPPPPPLTIDEQITFNSTMKNVIESSTMARSQDVVELTGTFLPYELLTAPTKYPYYHRSIITPNLTDTNSIVEITGTFIPQMMTHSFDAETDRQPQPITTTDKPLIIDGNHSMVETGKMTASKVKQATNQTFIIGNRRLSILSGIFSDNNDMGTAFIVACAHNSPLKTDNHRICDNVPIKIRKQRPTGQSTAIINGTLSVNLASAGKSLIVMPMLATGHNDNIKMIHAQIELNFNDNNGTGLKTAILSGLGWKNISKIEVNADRKYVPFMVKDLQPSIVDVRFDWKRQLSNVQFIETDNHQPSSLSLRSIVPTTTSFLFSNNNTVLMSSKITSKSDPPRRRMHTTTVGRFHEQDEENKSLLDSYFNGNIPHYDPTVFVEPTSSSVMVNRVRDTSTIFGFIHFTTIVNGTMLIFTPKIKSESPDHKHSTIKPTKVASFQDYLQIQTPSSLVGKSIPAHETITVQDEYHSLSPSMNPEFISSEKPDKYNEYLVTNDGITITSGFILPSFSSNVPNTAKSSTASHSLATKPLKLIATTFTTKHTDFITEQINGEIRTRTSEIISTNVIYNDNHSVRPTKPMKTFFTTYTYYTTFKNSETQFVHSRKEILTNIVDPDEDLAIIAPTSSSSITFSKSSETNDVDTSSAIHLIDTRPLSSSPLSSLTTLTTTKTMNDGQQQTSATPSLEEANLNVNNRSKPSMNKSYLGKLLSGIAVPITHYTTFTYYTTFFKDSTSQIVSRTNVISNIVTGTINLNQPPSSLSKQKRSINADDSLLANAAENLPIVITPVTELSTSTLYTTFFVPGQGSTVVTNTHIFSNIFLPDVEDFTRVDQSTNTRTFQNYPVIATINYFSPSTVVERVQEEPTSSVVRLINGIPVLGDQIVLDNTEQKRKTVVPYVAQSVREQLLSTSSLARIEIEGLNDSDNDNNYDIETTRRRKVIKVTKTRKLSNAFNTDDEQLPRKSTVIVRRPTLKIHDEQSNTILVDGHHHDIDRTGRLHSLITPTPVTYYTTYTYFTTELIDGRPVVRSNEHLFSTVITGKILPTRVVPDQHLRRIRRTASLIELDNNLSKTNDHHSSVTMESSRRIGVVSEMTDHNGDQTFVTQIIGTMINGLYAQFAITKTLESPASNPTAFIQSEMKRNESSDMDYETITEMSNNIDEESNTTTTESPIEIDDDDHGTKALDSEMMIDDSWLSDEQHSDHSSMLISSLGDIEPIFSTSKETPKLSSNSQTKPIIESTTTQIDYRTGLLSSSIETMTNLERQELIHLTKEIFGTYIGGIYAHLAKTRSETITLPLQTQQSMTTTTTASTFSDSLDLFSFNVSASASFPNANESTSFHSDLHVTSVLIIDAASKNISDPKETIISSPTISISPDISSSPSVSIAVVDTMIDSWPSLSGLSSISYATGTINDTLLVVHTTEFYTTQINGFTAHYSRETSNMIGTIDATTTDPLAAAKPSVHFPTPVRFLFSSSRSIPTPAQVITTVVTVTTTLFNEPGVHSSSLSAQSSGLIQSESNSLLASRKFKPIHSDNDNNQDYDDRYLLSSSSSGQMPRSRTIREKDNAQPFVDYDDDVDYADQIDTPAKPSSTTTTTAPKINSIRNSYWQPRRNPSGFGQRVGSSSSSSSSFNDPDGNLSNTRVENRENNRAMIAHHRRINQQSIAKATASSPMMTIGATRSSEFYHQNDYNQNNPSRSNAADDDRNSRRSKSLHSNHGRGLNRNVNRSLNRGRSHYSPAITATTTRNINLLTNQRLGLNRKYSRNRLPHPQQHISKAFQQSQPQSDSMDQSLKFGRGNYRSRLFPQPSLQPVVTSTVYATETIPKVPITVTSIATTVKTVPIFHGFRTSYATLTTTTLNTSIIPHTAYETSVDDERGTTRTLYTRFTDQLEPHRITEILVTTSALQEVRLVPIKFGYSTRTETLTDVKTFTMLTTLVSTDSVALLLPPLSSGFTLFTTTYLTDQTLSSTTSLSLLLHGKTLVSTLTFTSLTQTTVTKTLTVPIDSDSALIENNSQLVTLLTLSIRGDNGDITELVTAITVALDLKPTIMATKAERDVRSTDRLDIKDYYTDNERMFDDNEDYPLEGTESSFITDHHNNNNNNNGHHQFISASFMTVDSKLQSQDTNSHPYFITTIFKGPNTEIYEANALPGHDINDHQYRFQKRRLLQYSDNVYKEFSGSSSSSSANSFTPERSKPNRKFQRVRIKPKSATHSNHAPDSSSRLTEFNRLIGIDEINYGGESFNSFRRQPVQLDQPFNLYSSSAVVSIPPISSTASYLLANNFQKPTYRKIKPQQSRRIVSSIRQQANQPHQAIQPSHPLSSHLMIASSTLPSFIEIPNQFNHHHHHHYPRLPSSLPLQIQPDPRHVIQHINHAILPHKNRNNPVNQFNVHNVMDDRPPIGHETGSNYSPPSNNDLDVLRSTSSSSSSSVRQEPSSIHTPTIPLTYYTTFTYLTTVIRGQHTAHLSRESVTSTITTRALDKSIVEIVRDSDGVIEPTRLQELGTKTKGVATTIYNALYQVQIYNEDLYKVIQKTYNKQVSFKPWQPSTASYHPVFVTNHLDVPNETPIMEPSSSSHHNPEFDIIRTTKTNDGSTASSHNTASLSSSILEPSYQPVENTAAEPTPTIDSTLFSSPTLTRPSVRISSSVVRKPYNPHYTHPMSRSRLRMRVSSRTSHLPVIESSSSSSLISDIVTPSPSDDSIEETSSSSTNVSHRPNLFRSKVIFRPRPGQTGQPLNSKMIRISSRLVRPGATSSDDHHTPYESSSPTPTMVTSPTLQTLSSYESGTDRMDHSDAARANKFVRVSNGVTLIISSRVPTPTRPYTFEPTLVTGAAVMMKNIIDSQQESFSSSLTTHNEPIRPSMTTETVEYLRTSTLLSTITYFATLFNGSTSSITPIEDVKTEFITFPDTTTVTKPVAMSSYHIDGSMITSMSGQILFHPTDYITSAPKLSSTSAFLTSLKSTYTTLTHYITLFHGSHTVLSSIEEISPTVVTETFGVQQTKPSSTNVEHHHHNHHMANIRFTQPSIDAAKQSKNLFGGLVPSISTLFTTHTYYTTLFSGSTSIIQSREEITHSLITMYVPSSQLNQQPSIIAATSTISMPMSTELPSFNNYEDLWQSIGGGSSSSSQQTPSSIYSDYVAEDEILVASGSVQLEPSVTDYSQKLEIFTSTLKDTSDAVVYFTNFILPTNVVESENTIDGAKGPLLNHGDLTLIGDHNVNNKPILNPTQQMLPSMADSMETQSPAIKPGAIIELTDLLDGANLAGNIGEAIKDIVQILAKGQKNKMSSHHHPTPVLDNAALDIDRTSVVKNFIMPPKDGATVSHMDDPVYIPINLHRPQQNDDDLFPSPTMALPSSSFFDRTSSVYFMENMPPVVYFPVEFSQSTVSLPKLSAVGDGQPITSSISVQPSFTMATHELPSSSPSSSSSVRESYPTKSPIFSTAASNNVHVYPSETRTKYITSVYYTRDSPLTITSSYTSTMPLRTVVTTIVGSNTIVNTYGTEIKPTRSTLIPQTTATGDSSTRTRIQSTSSGSPFRPTRKPGVNRFKPPSRATEPPKIFKTSHRPRQPYKPSPTPPPDFDSDQQRTGGQPATKKTTKFSYPKTTTRPAILDLDQCKPGCNAANKEICKEFDGKFKCDCRPELQNFILLVRVTRLGDQELEWNSILSNHTSDLYQNLARAARNQIDSAYIMINSMKENYVGAEVLDINKAQDGHGVLVNMTIHLTESNNIDEDLIREELSRTLMMKPHSSPISDLSSSSSSEQLPSPQQIYADLEDVIDFDECNSEEYNDCASSARCINEPGSYRCECLNGYPDLDLSLPGRMCASEIKACEFCYGRGDCYRDETGQISSCKCHRMYLGRRCEINGLCE
ncbi:EGF and SEA domain containing protein [Euroglyphus maynei]|uniref:EGF and SEA domain containing protein n=1 Tax=Euroglyphus maynei TaxID=6958 RepID=A0A1Y3BHA4_EURMA|nr:EGF and SEA domain containing protein [Euroglyphus maynei]